MSTVDAPFVAAYELELDVDLPGVGVGPLQLFYPGATEAGGSSDLLVRVTPLAGRLCPRWPENLVANRDGALDQRRSLRHWRGATGH